MYCSNCGEKMEADKKYCPNCGFPVESDDLEEAKELEDLEEYTVQLEKKENIKQSGKKNSKKKKKKWPFFLIVIFILCFVGIGAIFTVKKLKVKKLSNQSEVKVEEGATVKNKTDKGETKKSTEIYANVYGKMIDGAYKKYGPDMQYFLYDIDHNGINELILQVGYSQEDYMYNIYTLDGENLKFLSQIEGAHSGFFEGENGEESGYIIQAKSFDNNETLYHIEISESGVSSEVISEEKTENYYSATNPLPSSNVTNKALLEQ